jgi:hypothetical protein
MGEEGHPAVVPPGRQRADVGRYGYPQFYDKVPTKFANYTADDFARGFRVVPPAWLATVPSSAERGADAFLRQHRRLRR